MATLRELITRWRFKTDTGALKDFAKGLGNVKITAERVGGAVKSMAKGIAFGMVASAAAVAYALKKSIDVAAEAEESESKFAAVFKKESAEMTTWSEKMAKAANRSAFELRDQAATFGALFNAMKFGGKDSANLSTHLVKLSQDLASFNNEAEKDVMIALRAGLLGSSEPVLKYGADVRVAAVNQELLAMGIKGGAKKATEQQKVLARLAIIMRATKDAQNDAVKTSGSWTNQMKGMNAAIKDLQVNIGSRLIPVLKPLLSGMRGGVASAAAWVKANEKLVDQNIKDVLEGLKDGWKELTSGMEPGDFKNIGKTIGDVLSTIGTMLKWVGKIAPVVWQLISFLPRMAGTAIGAIVAQVMKLGEYFITTYTLITGGSLGLWGSIKRIFKLIGMVLWQPFALLGAVAKAAFGVVLGVINGFFPGVSAAVTGFFSKISNGLSNTWIDLKGAATNAFNGVVRDIGGALKAGLTLFGSFFAGVGAWFAGLPKIIWDALVGGFRAALGAVIGQINAVKGKLGKVGNLLFGSGEIAMPTAAAPAAAGAAGGNGGPVVNTTVNVSVPPGTPASLANRVGDAASAATTRDLRSGLTDVRRR